MGTERIITERLILRKVSIEDSLQMYTNRAADPVATKYLNWKPHQTVEDVAAYLKTKENDYLSSDHFYWGIELKKEPQLIGTISVVEHHETIKTMEIGYVIGREWWYQGYTAEALAAVCDFLFRSTSVQRLEAFHDADNMNSGNVMKKCGFAFEGLLRQRGENNRGIVDECIYSLLRE